MHLFVTVGSTKFDSLVEEILSPDSLHVLKSRGYGSLTVQCGNSAFSRADLISAGGTASFVSDSIEIELWKFKPFIQEEYKKADLIISHAGSGTILEILRLPKPLIVVPNETLQDNHQEQLASILEEQGYLKSSTIRNLTQTILFFDASKLIPFPEFDGSKFSRLLDEEMGFI